MIEDMKMKTMLTKLMAVVLAVLMVIPVMAAYADCPNCGKYCSFTVGYDQWTANQHGIRGWCSGCGKDIWQGTNAGSHTMSNGVCTLCGYNDGSGSGSSGSGSGGGGTSCTHPRTATSWEGCTWYEYCTSCYVNLRSGVSHSGYTYGSWSHYNTLQHRREYTCTGCHETSYEYQSHSAYPKYNYYSSTMHMVGDFCDICGAYTSTSEFRNHSFTSGKWVSYNDTQHRRASTCSDCQYNSYEYGQQIRHRILPADHRTGTQ